MTYFEAIIIAIVEGITEYLPVSSTGHMIITEFLLGMKSDEFVKLYTVAIQAGAILAVVVLYWKRFFQSLDFYVKLAIACIPTAILGLLLDDHIEKLLDSVVAVGIALLLGGIFLLFMDQIFEENERKPQELTQKKSFWIGCIQALAMIPGTSRSATSILGGLTQGLDRKTATEFSFFLGVPTIGAATLLKLYKGRDLLTVEHLKLLGLGSLVGYVVAILAIKFFIDYIQKYGFKAFGWYRIVLGGLIVVLWALGVDLELN